MRIAPILSSNSDRYNFHMTILQSRLSGMYFRNFGEWVARAAEALQFDTPERARRFVVKERITDVAVRSAAEEDPGQSFAG